MKSLLYLKGVQCHFKLFYLETPKSTRGPSNSKPFDWMDHYSADLSYNPAMTFDPKLDSVQPEYRDIVDQAVKMRCNQVEDK